jgi:hypothetical protein
MIRASEWLTAFPGGAYTWELDGVSLPDIRAAFHFYATGITPAMALKKVGSNDKNVVQNKDGSYDIYFAPEAPEGKESNWVQTVPVA